MHVHNIISTEIRCGKDSMRIVYCVCMSSVAADRSVPYVNAGVTVQDEWK